MASSDYTTILNNLSYTFKDISLLELALTHRSNSRKHNERLEFLGDAVLNLCVAQLLYVKFPESTEGELSITRSRLVCAESLLDIAKSLDIAPFIKLGNSEGHSKISPSILSNVVEAVLGAIYCDSGFADCQKVVAHLYADKLEHIDMAVDSKDPKTRLQEYTQKIGVQLPIYNVLSITGAAHKQIFKVSCHIDCMTQHTTGEGRSRRKAEQFAAAEMMLKVDTEAADDE